MEMLTVSLLMFVSFFLGWIAAECRQEMLLEWIAKIITRAFFAIIILTAGIGCWQILGV